MLPAVALTHPSADARTSELQVEIRPAAVSAMSDRQQRRILSQSDSISTPPSSNAIVCTCRMTDRPSRVSRADVCSARPSSTPGAIGQAIRYDHVAAGERAEPRDSREHIVLAETRRGTVNYIKDALAYSPTGDLSTPRVRGETARRGWILSAC